MIGFNHLGTLGQLGNQMFQYAAVRGIAANKGYNFCLPNHNNVFEDGIGNKLTIEIFKPFKLKNFNNLNVQFIDQTRPVVKEGGFEFDEKLFNECPDWVSLWGFFQTEKYFKNIEQQIREDFEFRDEIREPCEQMISGVENPLSLHIRRGDFLTNSGNHHNLSLDYYKEALEKFDSDRNVIIFSDDPKWCAEQELFEDDRFLVADGNTSFVDMCLMSMCSDHIIANSTFSWWGAWLANGGKVIAPKTWFGPNNAHLNTADLYPDTWEVL